VEKPKHENLDEKKSLYLKSFSFVVSQFKTSCNKKMYKRWQREQENK